MVSLSNHGLLRGFWPLAMTLFMAFMALTPAYASPDLCTVASAEQIAELIGPLARPVQRSGPAPDEDFATATTTLCAAEGAAMQLVIAMLEFPNEADARAALDEELPGILSDPGNSLEAEEGTGLGEAVYWTTRTDSDGYSGAGYIVLSETRMFGLMLGSGDAANDPASHRSRLLTFAHTIIGAY